MISFNVIIVIVVVVVGIFIFIEDVIGFVINVLEGKGGVFFVVFCSVVKDYI